jgi:hypothetical protein
MNSAAETVITSFDKLNPEDQRVVAQQILRKSAGDEVTDDMAATARALFQALDEAANRESRGTVETHEGHFVFPRASASQGT